MVESLLNPLGNRKVQLMADKGSGRVNSKCEGAREKYERGEDLEDCVEIFWW